MRSSIANNRPFNTQTGHVWQSRFTIRIPFKSCWLYHEHETVPRDRSSTMFLFITANENDEQANRDIVRCPQDQQLA